MSFDGEGGGVAVGGREFAERPARGLSGVVEGAEESGGFTGREGYVEAVERQRETFAVRFNIGFLACPAIEEGARSRIGGKRAKHADFARREETLGDAFAFHIGAYVLDVDADFAPAREGVESQIFRVRDVEA